jgi:hypothetical protein
MKNVHWLGERWGEEEDKARQRRRKRKTASKETHITIPYSMLNHISVRRYSVVRTRYAYL